MGEKSNWLNIRNEYINGNISYRKLAEKHKVSFNTLQIKAREEKWFEKRKIQQDKIAEKTLQKTAEKIADKQAELQTRFYDIGTKLLDKIEKSVLQEDTTIVNNKRKYTRRVIDEDTGKPIFVDIEETVPKAIKTNKVNKSELKQIASALKDLKDILIMQNGEQIPESPNINITVVSATPEDMESDE